MLLQSQQGQTPTRHDGIQVRNVEYRKHDWEGWRDGRDLKEKEDTTVLYARD